MRTRATKRKLPRDRASLRRIETLESRTVFNADVAWDSAAALTLSFAPDGSQVGSHQSSLYATLHGFSEAQWQDTIVQAFQTWAQYVNVNIGVVGDTGVPFGTPTDATIRRFGDIRIGATPMSSETLAVSVPNDETTGGSWSGDVLFNSLGAFNDLDTLYKVALHEAGHVLGLDHNPDPLSPMYLHGPAIEPVPIASDIDQLMALYGARGPDRNELSKDNDSIGNATRLGLSDDDLNYDGSTPAIGFGVISTTTDSDYFELPNVSGYTGPIHFQLQTRGLSLLNARMTIVDKDGLVLGEASGQGHFGDVLDVTLPTTSAIKYYAKVEANVTDKFGLGGYAIVGSFVDRQTATESEIASVVDQAFRLIGYDEKSIDDFDIRGFLSHDKFETLSDDAHTDDDDAEATELKAVVSSTNLQIYHTVATISDSNDHDVYRLYSAKKPLQGQYMSVAIESLSPNGLIPHAIVRDRHGQELPAKILANGAGLYVVQIENVESDRQYFVEVASASSDPQFAVGNYKLSVTFSKTVHARDTLFSGALEAAQPNELHSLYVAKSQLFSLLFSTTASAPGGNAWMAIYDTNGAPLFYLAAPIGDARSATSLLLDPGEYLVEFGTIDAVATQVAYSLASETISHPIGPPIVDTTSTPIYACAGTPSSYCYPGEVVSTVPVNIAATTTSPTFGLIRPAYTPPADAWYWSTNQLSTNRVLPRDTNGDGFVTALDALLIINDLNAFGSRPVTRPPVPVGLLLDVNQDGFITPLDALLIINQLNAGTASGEPTSLAGNTPTSEAYYTYWSYLQDPKANRAP